MTRFGSLLRASALFVLASLPAPAWGIVRPAVAPDGMCLAAIAAVEPDSGLPAGLLAAIARVESGRQVRGAANQTPWPWTIDVEGAGAFFASEDEALAAVRAAQRDGSRSIDVGCMQVNLLHHPDAFANLRQAFDPVSNVAYAARLLRSLYAQTGDWKRAAALYHSATPSLGAEYQRKVLAAWSGGVAGAGAVPVSFRPLSAGFGGFGTPFGRGGVPALHTRTGPPMPAPSGHGRDLAAYRAMPIRLQAGLLLRR